MKLCDSIENYILTGRGRFASSTTPLMRSISWLQGAKLVADSGFHTEENVKMLMEEEIDGYVADTQFRKRDPRFTGADKYRERFKKERAEYYGTTE